MEILVGFGCVLTMVQNIAMIVPPPMSGLHDTYLRKFVETGNSVSTDV